jgi:hypothetical protein
MGAPGCLCLLDDLLEAKGVGLCLRRGRRSLCNCSWLGACRGLLSLLCQALLLTATALAIMLCQHM